MIITKPIGDYIEESLTCFGDEVNNRRQISFLYDGLKPVYRRVITTAFKYNKLTKTARIVGDCMGELHPHGDKSIADVVSNMVRFGIFDGQGNHGKMLIHGVDAKPSAMRYTEAMLSSKFRKFFGIFFHMFHIFLGNWKELWSRSIYLLQFHSDFCFQELDLGSELTVDTQCLQ